MPIRILVTGDREWACLGIAEAVVTRLVARYGSGIVIVHGGAKGWISPSNSPPVSKNSRPRSTRWTGKKYGRKAGPLSNQEMVDRGAELAIVVHRDLAGSRVAKDCVRRCLDAEIPVWLVDSEEVKPRRVTDL